MQIYESIIMAFQSIMNNKLRSFLTLLGITIGLFSIIIVMTAITAIQSSFEDVFSSIGTNNIIVSKYPAINMDWRKYRNRKSLTIEEGERLKEMTTIPLAVGIVHQSGGKTVKYENLKTNSDVSIIASNTDHLKASDLEVADGRVFGKQDIQYARNVCILGPDVAKKLFPLGNSPVGRTVRVGKLNLLIIGVFKPQGTMMGRSRDNFISIPISVYDKHYKNRWNSADYVIMSPSKEQFSVMQDEVIGALRIIRKVPLGEDNDFEITSNNELIKQFNDITKYFKIGAGVIAFIALLAAGVGIMNIMLVNVTERTREIGIRKAIGARKGVIRSQFISEAIVLSQVGGIIGILFGVIGGNIVALMLKVNIVVPVLWILIGLIVTTTVGLVFGVYPAAKASNLDPIEALRHE